MNTFHVAFVGYANPKFCRLMAHVQAERRFRMSYIVTSARDANVLRESGVAADAIHYIDERTPKPVPGPDERRYLASLEGGDVPTIHNMIMSDSVVGKLPYLEALAYAAHLARGFQRTYRELRPSVLIGGHDRVQASMASAVARAERIPWFALNYSTVPLGHVALSPGVVPDRMVELRDAVTPELRTQATDVLDAFEAGKLEPPAYVSAHNLGIALQRLGVHFREAARLVHSIYSGHFDKYSDHPFRLNLRRYVRKRRNMLRLPTGWFLREPPAQPFVFYGLHMQPESTPDVYAPLYSNQFDLLDKVSRSIPPTHTLLVKLHISDADAYSRKQLRQLMRLPGVQLVAPDVSSRAFIDRAACIATIAGTMGMEGALLGKPVVVFGKMDYNHFPGVRRVLDVYDLPELIRRQLAAPKPAREEILAALAVYLQKYFRATAPDSKVRVDDFRAKESESEKIGFCDAFRALEAFVRRNTE